MNRHSQLQAGIKDQENLLRFKKGPASYPDTALLLLWTVRGSQPSSAGREAPPWGSQLITAGVKRINQGELEWYLWGGLLGQSDRAERRGKVCRPACHSLEGRGGEKSWEEAMQNTCITKKLKLDGKLLCWRVCRGTVGCSKLESCWHFGCGLGRNKQMLSHGCQKTLEVLEGKKGHQQHHHRGILDCKVSVWEKFLYPVDVPLPCEGISAEMLAGHPSLHLEGRG